MRRVIPIWLLIFLPFTGWTDGIVLPTLAYPAHVSIPDQQAALAFSNGMERLVIETRFTGAGTNFAWVVPFPSSPVIEEATTGFFPTLRFLTAPKIVHEVPHFYASILAAIGIGCLFLFVRPTGRIHWTDILSCVLVATAAATTIHEQVFNVIAFFFVSGILFCDVVLIRLAKRPAFGVFALTFGIAFCFFSMLLPAGLSGSTAALASTANEKVSVLDRKIVGVFETTTISSRDSGALASWLADHDFVVPANAAPIISNYVQNGWVFVTAKLHRDTAASGTATPHPLSFTFKAEKPVYPMRLTGTGGQPLNVDLYVLGDTSATAPHFVVKSSLRQKLAHPLLQRWFHSPTVITKLTATLSNADLGADVWVNFLPDYVEHQDTLYSREGAVRTAVNDSAYVLAIGLLVVGAVALVCQGCRPKAPRLIIAVLVGSLLAGAVRYEFLPQTEVKLVKFGGLGFHMQAHEMENAIRGVFETSPARNIDEVRVAIGTVVANATNASSFGLSALENPYLGGYCREEDSPGNYVLQETNNSIVFIPIGPDGREEDNDALKLPHAEIIRTGSIDVRPSHLQPFSEFGWSAFGFNGAQTGSPTGNRQAPHFFRDSHILRSIITCTSRWENAIRFAVQVQIAPSFSGDVGRQTI